MEKSFQWKIERFTGLNIPSGSEDDLKSGDSPSMVNFKITEGGKLKKREGFTTVLRTEEYVGGTVRGIWHGSLQGKSWYLAVVGEELCGSESGFGALDPIASGVLGEGEVFFFPFFGKLYLLTGVDIYCFDGESMAPLEPYVPLVMVATTNDGDGVLFEEKNILTDRIRQSFSPDGESLHFVPVLREIAEVCHVTRRGETVDPSCYYWDEGHGMLRFTQAPSAGTDDLEVEFRLAIPPASERILHCRRAMSFGGGDTRAFLYGNADDPSMRYHSGIVDGKPCFSYFPETAYTRIGSGEAVTAVLRHYDRQLIFTPRTAYYSFLEYRTGADGQLLASFPVLPLSDSYGCVAQGQALLMENTPVTLDEVGLCRWISTNIRDERNAQRFSEVIAHALKQVDLSQGKIFYRKASSELYLCVGERLFVYHEKTGFFYCHSVPRIRGFLEVGESLYFHTEDRICVVGGRTDDGVAVEAKWVSKALPLSLPGIRKQLHRFFADAAGSEGASLSVELEKEETGEKEEFSLALSQKETQLCRRVDQRRAFSVRLSLCSTADELLIARLGFIGTAQNRI